jgi:hypothetical protein
MDTVWDLDWRLYPALALVLCGAATALRGDLLLFRGLRLPNGTRGKNLLSVRGLRLALLGLSIAAVGTGWWLQWPAMVAAGLVIGFEETLETSIAAWALEQEAKGRAGYR